MPTQVTLNKEGKKGTKKHTNRGKIWKGEWEESSCKYIVGVGKEAWSYWQTAKLLPENSFPTVSSGETDEEGKQQVGEDAGTIARAGSLRESRTINNEK